MSCFPLYPQHQSNVGLALLLINSSNTTVCLLRYLLMVWLHQLRNQAEGEKQHCKRTEHISRCRPKPGMFSSGGEGQIS